MPTVEDICHEVRSKNAGPFWVTIDLFFRGPCEFDRFVDSQALAPPTFAKLFGVDEAQVKHFPVKALNVLKVSYPRPLPQGGVVERDMHAGQQFVRVLRLPLD